MKKSLEFKTLRIIGGAWRSRKIAFAPVPGLRPTPDRVRETVFNWLSLYIEGATCLDLFAGSGALGFEALSRGAAQVVMLDKNPQVIAQLQANANTLGTKEALISQAEVPQDLAAVLPQFHPARDKFDIVFLDPPFHQQLISPCCFWLEEYQWLHQPAYIYIEFEIGLKELALPKNWQVLKQKSAGLVNYRLYQRN